MRLHKILFRHCAPKDCAESIKLYVIANTEEEILFKLADPNEYYTYGSWMEIDEEDPPIAIYDDNYNIIGTETYLQKMLRIRGEFNDEDAIYEDAYYGVSHYGWDEGQEIFETEAEILLKLNVAEDWRK